MNTDKLTYLLSNYPLRQLQLFNQQVYAIVNLRNFELHDMVCRLCRFNARVLLRVRKQNTDKIGYHLCMMLSWLCALANRMVLDMHGLVASHCVMTLSSEEPFTKMQTEFASRHKEATLEAACLCLAEKVFGIASAFEYYRETHDKAHIQDVAKKMAQTVEALFVVASILRINLGDEFEQHFKEGCSACHSVPCECGFKADKVV